MMDLIQKLTAIAGNISTPTILNQSIVNIAADLTSSTRGHLLIENGSVAHCNPRFIKFSQEPSVPYQLFTQVIMQGEPITNFKQITDPYLQEHNPQIVYCTPLIFQDKTLGALYLEDGENYETDQFKYFLQYVSVVMSEAEKHHHLQDRFDQSTADLKQRERTIEEKEVEIMALVNMFLSGPKIASDMTKRQRVILTALAKGYNKKEISLQLSIDEKTVRNHISNSIKKLGAKNISHAIALATHYKIISVVS